MIGEVISGLGKWFLSRSIWKHELDKMNKKVADDVALAVQKAHLGKLPKGVYCDQIIWTRKMTREQLCVPLDADTLRRMAECTVIRHHGVEVVGLDSRMETFGKNGSVTLSVSSYFDGETADGQRVLVDIRKALLSGKLVRDKMTGWMLTELKEIKL